MSHGASNRSSRECLGHTRYHRPPKSVNAKGKRASREAGPLSRNARGCECLVLCDRILRPRRSTFVCLQSLVGQLNCFLELGIMAADNQVGPLRHHNVGIDAVLLDHPLAAVVRTPEAEARRCDEATIAQRLRIADAD